MGVFFVVGPCYRAVISFYIENLRWNVIAVILDGHFSDIIYSVSHVSKI